MIDKDLSIDRSRTSPLKPEPEKGVETGGLIPAVPLPSGDTFPLNYARIGYENKLYGGTSISSMGNITAGNLLFPDTYSKWVIDGATSLEYADITPADTSSISNYVGIAAHSLKGATLEVVLRISGGANLGIYNQTVATNDAIYINMPDDTYDLITINIVNNESSKLTIGVVYMGRELQMMRPIYGGHKPVNLSPSDKVTPQVSDGGQFLGKQIVKQGFSTQADFKHLEGDWYRNYFVPFSEHAKTLPYFWAWNLGEHPGDVVYAWTNEMISPTLMGMRNWFEVSFSIEAHA